MRIGAKSVKECITNGSKELYSRNLGSASFGASGWSKRYQQGVDWRTLARNYSPEVMKASLNGDIIKEKSFDELKGYIGKLDNLTVRKWYVYHDTRIHNEIDASMSVEEQARQTFALRNQYRAQARDLMADQNLRAELDAKYPSKTWEEMIRHKTVDKGMSYEEAVLDIYRTSAQSNKKVNASLGLKE